MNHLSFLGAVKNDNVKRGAGILIRIHPAIEINSPDVNDPRIMAINLKIHGFNVRIVNGYSPTETGGSK